MNPEKNEFETGDFKRFHDDYRSVFAQFETGMHKVSIIAKLSKFDQLKSALNDLGVTGMTVTQVMGCGI